MARSYTGLLGVSLVALLACGGAAVAGPLAHSTALRSKRWLSGGNARSVAPTGARYWRLTLFDDFKGKPSSSARDNLCYDQTPAQCHIWPGGSSFRCDLAHLPESDASMLPPLRENWAAVLNAVDPSRDWSRSTLAAVKSRYGQLLAERTRHLDKCTWTLYGLLNWMSTDYQGHWAARFDGLAVRVLPEGPGYLELSAFRAPLSVPCALGGVALTVGNGSTVPDVCKIGELPAGVQPVAGVRYWVDGDARWPGVYYAAQGGACPHGGTLAGPNCRLLAFAPGELVAGLSYGLRGRDVLYTSTQRERCQDNILYEGGVRFQKLVCPIVNGGLMSASFDAQGGVPRGFTQKYGRFEAKLRLPKGEGAFPAAWLMPVKGGWPYSGGEIDILEARDNADEAYQTYHHGKCYRRDTVGPADSYLEAITYWDAEGRELPVEPGVCNASSTSCVASYRTTSGQTGRNPPGSCVGRFALREYLSLQVSVGHTEKGKALAPMWLQDNLFAVEWTPARIDYFMNRVRTHTVAVGTQPTNNYATGATAAALPASLTALGPHNFPRDPFYWILNHSTWVRPDRRGSFQPQRLLIDYVKAYTACTDPAELCPCGGAFTEGTGCVLGRAPLACPAGEARPTTRVTPAGVVYASPCVNLDVPAPSTADQLQVAIAAVRQLIQQKLQGFVTGLTRVWSDVVAFFGNLRHWLESNSKCMTEHVVPSATRLGAGLLAEGRAQLDAFWREVAPAVAGMTAADRVAVLRTTFDELRQGLAQRRSAATNSGVGTVRGWFTKAAHKDAAQAAFTSTVAGYGTQLEDALTQSFAANTR